MSVPLSQVGGIGQSADDSRGVISVALVVQIHLQQNRTDLALKEVQAAKRWAQDSLLVNLAESWVGMRVVRIEWRISDAWSEPHTNRDFIL